MYKNIKFFAFILTLGLATGLLISCNDDDDGGSSISAEERAVLEDLIGTWTATEVTQDGEAPQAGDYSNLVLSIDADLSDGSNKVYSVTGGDLAFPNVTNASWSFVDGSVDTDNPVIRREDGELMRIMDLSSTTLVLRQEVAEELGDGRVAHIGTYLYTFTK